MTALKNLPVMVWPWWVRLSHWLVAAGVMALWMMRYVWFETGWWHRTLGYVVCGIVLMRMIAGCFAEQKAAGFYLPGLKQLCEHLTHIYQGKLGLHYGHNPLGQYAVYLIWMLIGLLAFTGWLSQTDTYWGEDWPVDLHAAASWGLMAIVCLHILAVFVIGRLSHQRLIRQMLHGQLDRSR